MAADIDQVEGEMIVIDPMVAKGIATQGCGWYQPPGGANASRFDRRRQDGPDIVRGLGDFMMEPFKGLVSLR